MGPEEASSFATRWAEAWNRRDLDAVLRHFDDRVVFSSPKALDVIGAPTVVGRGNLGDYWRAALSRIDQLHFSVDRVLWDARRSELAIIYDRHVNGHRDRAIEMLRFNAMGAVVSGEVFYGVQPEP